MNSVFPLIETIAIRDGQIQNLAYHQRRYEQGVQFLKSSSSYKFKQLAEVIDIPSEFLTGLVRCRVDYNADEMTVAFYPYQARKISSFKIVEQNDIDYRYKYADRNALNELVSQKQDCDDIIVIKNQYVTDSSIANLLFLKNGIWYTPHQPLLQGTQRAKLLDEQKITSQEISISQIFDYEKIMFINALNEFDEQRAIHITPKSIVF